MRSDQGVQYTSCEFVNFCKDNNVTQSMSKAWPVQFQLVGLIKQYIRKKRELFY